MQTQISIAKDGKISDELYVLSRTEKVDIESLRYNIAQGKIVVLKNNMRGFSRPVAIGNGLKTKIGVEIGLTSKKTSIENETDKVIVAKEAGADIILDNTTGYYFDELRRIILNTVLLPYGTVPVFQTAYVNPDEFDVLKINKDNIFSTIEKHLSDGVDFICLNCGLTKDVVKHYESEKFLSIPSSKEGILTACAIKETGLENPLYEYYDELLELIKKYDATLFLSQALRASSVQDSYSRASVIEANISAELASRANKANVQAIIESGGYIRLDKVSSVIKTIKELANNSPLFSREIVPTDIALGYETISSSIGYTNAILAGSNLLFAVQNSIGNSNLSGLKDGIMAAKIAANCADITKNVESQTIRNENILKAIKNKDTILYRQSLIDGYSTNTEILDKINEIASPENKYFEALYNNYFN